MGSLKLTVLIIGAAVLAAASVWGISRLSGPGAQPAASGSPAPSPAAAGTQDAAGVVVEVLPLYIVKDETRYELVGGREGALGVRLVIENMPDEYEVRLGDSKATVDDDQRLPGGGNRREVFATANFAAEIERMRQNPDEQLRLPVEVKDLEAADNNATIAIYIDPRRLRLDARGAPAAPVKVERAEGPAARPADTVRVITKKSGGWKPEPTRQGAAGSYEREGPRTRPDTQETRPRGASQNPPARRPTPKPTVTPKPCNKLQRALGLC